MGERQKTLERMFREAGYPVGVRTLPRPSIQVRASGELDWGEVDRVYKELDGALPECPMKAGPWDIALGDVAVELDEEQHFNRYRLITLGSSLYSTKASFPLSGYQSQCRLYERECLSKAGNRGYWSNSSTIAQFGPASTPGELRPPGAPRWKQRAFYDFLKDLAPEITGTHVARISVWDILQVDAKSVRVLDVLDRFLHAAVPALVELIEHRAGAQLAC